MSRPRTATAVGSTLLLAALTACGGGDSKPEVAPTPLESTDAFKQAVAAEASRLADERVAALASAEAQASALAEVAAAAAAPPKPTDFKLGVKTLKKTCYGSAGCNVIIRIAPTYVGADDSAATDLEVTYTITGDEDGPKINTFTVDSAGTVTQDSEETVSTSSSATKISAKVTSVEKA